MNARDCQVCAIYRVILKRAERLKSGTPDDGFVAGVDAVSNSVRSMHESHALSHLDARKESTRG